MLSISGMTADERRKMRAKKGLSDEHRQGVGDGPNGIVATAGSVVSDDRLADLLKHREDDFLKFVAQVNHVYQDKLKKNAPFMTFMFCGMQSAGWQEYYHGALHERSSKHCARRYRNTLPARYDKYPRRKMYQAGVRSLRRRSNHARKQLEGS